MDHIGNTRYKPASDIALKLSENKKGGYHCITGDSVTHLLIGKPQTHKIQYHQRNCKLYIYSVFSVPAVEIIRQPRIDGGLYITYYLTDIIHNKTLRMSHMKSLSGKGVSHVEAYGKLHNEILCQPAETEHYYFSVAHIFTGTGIVPVYNNILKDTFYLGYCFLKHGAHP